MNVGEAAPTDRGSVVASKVELLTDNITRFGGFPKEAIQGHFVFVIMESRQGQHNRLHRCNPSRLRQQSKNSRRLFRSRQREFKGLLKQKNRDRLIATGAKQVATQRRNAKQTSIATFATEKCPVLKLPKHTCSLFGFGKTEFGFLQISDFGMNVQSAATTTTDLVSILGGSLSREIV